MQSSETNHRKWNVMMYMAGANNSLYVRLSLVRLKAVKATGSCYHILAQFDTGEDGLVTKRYCLTPLDNAKKIADTVTSLKDGPLNELKGQFEGWGKARPRPSAEQIFN